MPTNLSASTIQVLTSQARVLVASSTTSSTVEVATTAQPTGVTFTCVATAPAAGDGTFQTSAGAGSDIASATTLAAAINSYSTTWNGAAFNKQFKAIQGADTQGNLQARVDIFAIGGVSGVTAAGSIIVLTAADTTTPCYQTVTQSVPFSVLVTLANGGSTMTVASLLQTMSASYPGLDDLPNTGALGASIPGSGTFSFTFTMMLFASKRDTTQNVGLEVIGSDGSAVTLSAPVMISLGF